MTKHVLKQCKGWYHLGAVLFLLVFCCVGFMVSGSQYDGVGDYNAPRYFVNGRIALDNEESSPTLTIGNDTLLYANVPFEKVEIVPDLYLTGDLYTSGCQLIHVWAGDSIQTAINSITDSSASKPYTVLIHPGIYTGQITIINSYISLQGEGELMPTISYISSGNSYEYGALRIDASNVEIRNLRVINPGVGGYGGICISVDSGKSGIIIDNCHLIGWQDTFWSATSTVRIENCYIRGGYDTVTSFGNIKILNNYITAEGGSAVLGQLWLRGSSTVEVVGNYFYASSQRPVGYIGDPSSLNIYYAYNYIAHTQVGSVNGVFKRQGTWTGKVYVFSSNGTNWESAYTEWITQEKGNFGSLSAGGCDFGSVSAVSVTSENSFTIGLDELEAMEWGYLDDQDQSVRTTSSPTFANVNTPGYFKNTTTTDHYTWLLDNDTDTGWYWTDTGDRLSYYDDGSHLMRLMAGVVDFIAASVRCYQDAYINNGKDLLLYSDDGGTLKGSWDGATGDISAGDLTVVNTVLFTPTTTDTVTATEGRVYYRTDTKHLYVYNGTDWLQLDNSPCVTLYQERGKTTPALYQSATLYTKHNPDDSEVWQSIYVDPGKENIFVIKADRNREIGFIKKFVIRAFSKDGKHKDLKVKDWSFVGDGGSQKQGHAVIPYGSGLRFSVIIPDDTEQASVYVKGRMETILQKFDITDSSAGHEF